MTIGKWLIETMIKLRDAGVDSPRRDALVLLEDTLQKDRAWMTTHPEFVVGEKDLQAVNALVRRRLNREPLAYIRGKAWFYSRFFEVSSDVLIPRPESEDFIELLKQRQPEQIIDIGTGSGALAITAALELPITSVIATDNSPKALKVAQTNAQIHKVDITFLHGNLLDPVKDTILGQCAVIANLPYVPQDMVTSPEIAREPAEALFSGPDGLDHYEAFWQQVEDLSIKPKYILTESLEKQHPMMCEIASKSSYDLVDTSVLVQCFSYSS